MGTSRNNSGNCVSRHNSKSTCEMKKPKSEGKEEEAGLLLWPLCQIQVKTGRGLTLFLTLPYLSAPLFSTRSTHLSEPSKVPLLAPVGSVIPYGFNSPTVLSLRSTGLPKCSVLLNYLCTAYQSKWLFLQGRQSG